jgi:Spy/CpxP family protein refolding chaperone
MRLLSSVLFLSTVLAGSAFAQRPGGQMQQRQMPDHWMTIDSLVELVGITEEQVPQIEEPYAEVNSLMAQAVEERGKMREQMSGGRPNPDQMAAFRTKFEFMQTDLDKAFKKIRDVLTEEQQERYDALTFPRVMMQRRG